MKEQDPVQRAIINLRINRDQTETRLFQMQGRLENKSGFILARAVRNILLKRQIEKTQKFIGEQQHAEAGLHTGDYSVAVKFLNKYAAMIDETPLQFMWRISHQPPPKTPEDIIRNSPSIQADNMRRLANELDQLQRPQS